MTAINPMPGAALAAALAVMAWSPGEPSAIELAALE
jgi:hypothetical protein